PVPAAAPPPAEAPAAPAANDYGDKANWLCWPGRADGCQDDLTATIAKADGPLAKEAFKADPKAPIDCFYVYPTVSRDPTPVSDMVVKPEETNVVRIQAARLTAKCRLYAPMYRQFTLTALSAFMNRPPAAPGAPPAPPPPPRPQVGYNDVKDAWNYYLQHENHGRGVVLIGHSQGSGVLTQLIKNEIDGKPAQKQVVSAILMGTVLSVPVGKDVGGDFQTMPLCHSASQLGCVIAFSSFRETSPPPENSLFGRPRFGGQGMEAACVNPASLGGGAGALKSYFNTFGPAQPFVWVKGATIATPFVAVPGMLTGACVHTGPFNYLSIHINAATAGPRANNIPGDLTPQWGLHLIDANLVMGNLLDVVGAESKAWAAKGGH
ncbi:MAG: DUF3089 domain-containing protein, partial [Caulobacterales bacterium]